MTRTVSTEALDQLSRAKDEMAAFSHLLGQLPEESTMAPGLCSMLQNWEQAITAVVDQP
jgi:hypothetical protein